MSKPLTKKEREAHTKKTKIIAKVSGFFGFIIATMVYLFICLVLFAASKFLWVYLF